MRRIPRHLGLDNRMGRLCLCQPLNSPMQAGRGMKGNRNGLRSLSALQESLEEGLGQELGDTQKWARQLRLFYEPVLSLLVSNPKSLLKQVLAETRDHNFIIHDGRGIAEVTTFALNVFANFFLDVFLEHVYIDILEFDVVVFQELFGHLAPDACAQRVQNNLMLVFLTCNLGELHGLPRYPFSLTRI